MMTTVIYPSKIAHNVSVQHNSTNRATWPSDVL